MLGLGNTDFQTTISIEKLQCCSLVLNLGTLFEKAVQDKALKFCRYVLLMSLNSFYVGILKEGLCSYIMGNKMMHAAAI